MEWFTKEAGPKQGRKTRQMERKPLKLVCKKKKKKKKGNLCSFVRSLGN